jgi:hypothetical protein
MRGDVHHPNFSTVFTTISAVTATVVAMESEAMFCDDF